VAVWNETRNNIRYKINDVDHAPPHCHVFCRGRLLRVGLETFELLKPSGATLPSAVWQYLKENRLEMLAAWQRVQNSDGL